MPVLDITSVSPANLQHSSLRGFCIDSPQPGPLPTNADAMRIEGWVLATDQPIRAVLLFCQGALLRTLAPERRRPDVAQHFPGAQAACGFSTTLTPVELPPQFELQLFVSFQNGSQLCLGTVAGKHDLRPPQDANLLRPLMITSRGRSGTTYLMRLLSQHPRIVADRTYPYETKAAVHWLHLLRVLTQPQPSVSTAEPFDRGDWPIPPYVPPQTVASPAFANYIAHGYPPQAAAFCLGAADGFYRQIAAAQGQPDPLYYCEKIPPNGLQIMAWNLYTQPREIFLVRDFRDMVCSVFAFNAKRGQVGFGRQHAASDEAYIKGLREAVALLLQSFQSRRERSCLVRYEDLVRHPEETLRPLLAYLDLESSDPILHAMTQSASSDTPQLERHRTSASPEQSIGRWLADLSPPLQRLCRAAFDDLLPQFGYHLNPDGSLRFQDA